MSPEEKKQKLIEAYDSGEYMIFYQGDRMELVNPYGLYGKTSSWTAERDRWSWDGVNWKHVVLYQRVKDPWNEADPKTIASSLPTNPTVEGLL